jgi:hypothetical protein
MGKKTIQKEESDSEVEIQDVKPDSKTSAPTPAVKPKRQLTEKQLETLAKGREARKTSCAEKQKVKEEIKELKEEAKEKKKEKIIKTITKLKQKVEQPDEESESDEEIVIKKAKSLTKKPKRKVIIMESESESSSEDEQPAPSRTRAKPAPQKPTPQPKQNVYPVIQYL